MYGMEMSSTTASEKPPMAWDEARVDSISDRLCELAGQLNVVHAQVTETVAEALETGLWEQGGVTTPEQFVAWKLGVSPEFAKHVVRVARRRHEFPTVVGALDRGELSVEQTAVAVKAPAWADDQIADIARVCTVAKLRVQMRSRNFEDAPDETPAPPPAPEPAPEPTNSVSFGPTDDGRWRIRGEFDVVTGERIEAALTERRDALFTDGDEQVTWADAVVDCFERSLDEVGSPSRRDRFRTWIHLDADATATTTAGWRIPMALADRVLCDGVVQPVWERDGVPFSVGRSQRIVPDRTRRIVERRDRGCRVPGCTADRFVEVHHIEHWLDGGATDTANLVSLCPKHHRMHHQGRLGISGDADDPNGVTFTDEHGRSIHPGSEPRPPTADPPGPVEPYVPPPRGRLRRQSEWIHPDALARRATAARQLIEQRAAA